jgi:hypothetical protein
MRNFVEEDEAREQIMDLTRQRNMPADEVLKQSWLLWKGILKFNPHLYAEKWSSAEEKTG